MIAMRGGNRFVLTFKNSIFALDEPVIDIIGGTSQALMHTYTTPYNYIFIVLSHTWVIDYDEACFMHLTP